MGKIIKVFIIGYTLGFISVPCILMFLGWLDEKAFRRQMNERP